MSSTILKGSSRGPANVASADAGWRSLGWFGFFMAAIGLGQLALYFFPATGFGSPEWEYGASAQMIGALPLPTVGLAALIAAAFATGSRRGLIGLSIVFVLLGLVVFAALALFWSVAPMAMRATPEAADSAIQQTIARTTLSGLGFGLLYMWAAFVAMRQARRFSRRAVNA
ncbi:MAG TPA: hypothetical protein VK912_06915 [Longimicrobiales bacterium]|nr:hypothetical protein [Longimicrobiales bacterium]